MYVLRKIVVVRGKREHEIFGKRRKRGSVNISYGGTYLQLSLNMGYFLGQI
jgi:hypothetical protein